MAKSGTEETVLLYAVSMNYLYLIFLISPPFSFLKPDNQSAHKGTHLHGTLSHLSLLGHHFINNPGCMAVEDWRIYNLTNDSSYAESSHREK